MSEFSLTPSSYERVNLAENGIYLLDEIPCTVTVDLNEKTIDFGDYVGYALIVPSFDINLSDTTTLVNYYNTIANCLNIQISSKTDNLRVRDLNIIFEFNGVILKLENLVNESELDRVVSNEPISIGIVLFYDNHFLIHSNVKIMIGGLSNGQVSGMIELYTA